MKLIVMILLFILAIVVLADRWLVMGGDFIVRSQCQPFKEISNDPALNERLRTELADFVNDEKNRHSLDRVGHLSFVALNKYSFDESPFPWLSVFDEYPAYQPDLELALRFDHQLLESTPSYRISEVGIYGARSLLMYKNKNEAQFTGDEGAVRLSEKSSVKCEVSFSRGVPVE